MIFLSLEELEQLGVPRQQALQAPQIEHSNRLFVRVRDYAPEERQTALNDSKHMQRGCFAFLADTPLGYTLWQERQPEAKKSSYAIARAMALSLSTNS